MKKVLVIVDMQNDFVDGALGTAEAQVIAPKVADYIREHADEIAVNTQAKILRKLRHPKNSKAFRDFLVYKDENDIK